MDLWAASGWGSSPLAHVVSQVPAERSPGLQPGQPAAVPSDLACVSPQELLLLLQNLPTALWGDEDVSLLLAEAYRLKFAFADAPNHYKR